MVCLAGVGTGTGPSASGGVSKDGTLYRVYVHCEQSRLVALSPHRRDLLGQHGDYLQTVANQPEFGHLEDRRVRVLVDGYDRVG